MAWAEWLRRLGGAGEGVEAAWREIRMFADASFAFEPDMAADEAAVSRCVHWYFVGAARALARHRGLSRDHFRRLAAQVLAHVGVAEAAAGAMLQALDAARMEQSVGRGAIEEGDRALMLWLDGGDTNAPLRLAELVREWRDTAGEARCP